jgi:hypothetical protein
MVFSLFWIFCTSLPIKLNTHGSNLNSKFVIRNELEFFLLIKVLTQNFNFVDLVKFLEIKSKTSHLDHSGHIKGDIMQNHKETKE